MVHVAITRRVLPGYEAEFEARVRRFFERADRESGTAGAFLLRPVDAAEAETPREYGIVRAFEDEQARERFYASPLYAEWNQAVSEIVEGEPEKRPLHGLEAFFRSGGEQAPPPAWKMAILTWLAVNPAVFASATLVKAVFGPLPMLADLLLVSVLVVGSLTWLLMPLMTRLAGGWLRSDS